METQTVPTICSSIDADLAEMRESELQLARQQAAITAKREYAEVIRQRLNGMAQIIDASAGALAPSPPVVKTPAAVSGASRRREALDKVNAQRKADRLAAQTAKLETERPNG